MFRSISLYLRRRSDRKDTAAVQDTRVAWLRQIDGLPMPVPGAPSLAIVRLDDIGDYLLFRNFLEDYKESPRWAGYRITLIGNAAWKSLLEQFDRDTVDEVLWVDKGKYWADEAYRWSLWLQLRQQHFTAIACPSRTRPLLLDDMIVAASAAPVRYGVTNTYAIPEWNRLSDAGYTMLLPATTDSHEFYFNRHFSNWINEAHGENLRPELPRQPELYPKQVICFIGASAKSKRWSPASWISLVRLLQQQGYEPVIGGGPQEMAAAAEIAAATGAVATAGTTSLADTLASIARAHAVISGDTMAAHAAVAYQKPVVILANGVNAARFVDYQAAGISGVTTLFTRPYLLAFQRCGGHPATFAAVSDDMKTISPEAVLAALQQLLRAC